MKNQLQKANTAVIVIDVQNDYVHNDGFLGKVLGTKSLQGKVGKMNQFLEQIRAKNVPIIHIQMTEGRNTIDPALKEENIKKHGDYKNWELAIPGTWGYELVLKVNNEEKIFKKNAYDTFGNKEFGVHLEEQGIRNLVIFGGYTHACVNATVRSAFKKRFNVILVKDLVGSPDKLQELHEKALATLTAEYAQGYDAA